MIANQINSTMIEQTRIRIYLAFILSFSILNLTNAYAQNSAPDPNFPTAEEMQSKLNTMTPEKREKILKDLRDSLDKLSLLTDLQKGKCDRAPEVEMKAIGGDADAIYTRSEMYRFGYCLPKDSKKFQQDLITAAKKGTVSASYDIGFYLMHGEEGFQKDISLARSWFEKAIKDGDEPRSKLLLGDILVRGDGGNRDIEKGLKLLNELADLAEDNREASGEALRFLSIYYIMGQNFSPDIAIGRKYAIQGSEICVGSTMSIMAMSYLQENPPNYFMAYAWANVAINHSNEQFRNAAVKIRESTRVNLTQNQMISAEAASKKFPVCTK